MSAVLSEAFAAYLTTKIHARRDVCAWACRLCGDGTLSRDPVAAIRAHLAEAHGATTPTRVSTDVRDAPRSIYDGTRWGR